jgi:hypothetical protein
MIIEQENPDLVPVRARAGNFPAPLRPARVTRA